MFEVYKEHASSDPAPWNVSIYKRLRMIEGKPRKKIIAYYYNKYYDNSTFRYRCYNMCEVINENSDSHGLIGTWFIRQDAELLINFMEKVHTLVICRSTLDTLTRRIIYIARLNGVRILFDVDDLVIDQDFIPLIVDTVTSIPKDHESEDSLWNYWYAYVGRLRATLLECDAAIVTTSSLAQILETKLSLEAKVIPNFMDKTQIDFSRKLFNFKYEGNFSRNNFFTVGYFSGSPSHNKDFALASPAIVELMLNYKEIDLLIGGYIDTDIFERNGLERRVMRLPYSDHLELQRNISSVEINIAPLQQNLFSGCKSVLKYFDAAAVGVPTIASPTDNMKVAITAGENGYIAEDSEWLKTLSIFIANYAKNGVAMNLKSYADAHNNYSGTKFEPEIVNYFDT